MSNLTLGNKLPGKNAAIQSNCNRNNSLTSGHRACQGCGEALGARCAIDAAHHAAGGKIVVVNATGCLEVFSCSFPENAWNVPWLHSLFGNAPAIATGVAAALRVQGKEDIRVVAQGGDGATYDIGMGCLSGMFDRNEDVLYICYDNQAYMNTGVQRSGATPPLTRTATTVPHKNYSGNDPLTGKNVLQIAMAHGIPYVAAASIGNIQDLERKVSKAINIRGSKYLNVHVPCPLGWGYPTSETIKIARLAIQCGLFPLFEAEYGKLTESTPIEDPVPVEEYLKPQKRFAHLFGKNASSDAIGILQRIADSNRKKYRLNGENLNDQAIRYSS
jgi:pyruvate ferredoxin oxidoreductase beta subunit